MRIPLSGWHIFRVNRESANTHPWPVGYNLLMRSIYRLVCATAVFLWAATLGAQDPQWFEVRSENFLLFTDSSEAKGRQLLMDFESRVSAVQRALGTIPKREFPIEVF